VNKETFGIDQQIAEYFSAIRARDVRRLMLTFSQDARLYDPVGRPPQVGATQIERFFADIFARFRDVKLTEESVYVCGTSVAVKWVGNAIGPSGASCAFAGIDTFECSEIGTINEVRAFWDIAPVMALLES
jgi:steroid Delta-isomerase